MDNENLQFTIDTSRRAPNTSTESLMRYRKLKSFDCGECFVGEQVTLPLMIKNVGGEGRFFIMSEIDWCSMHIEVRVIVLQNRNEIIIDNNYTSIFLFYFRMLLPIMC